MIPIQYPETTESDSHSGSCSDATKTKAANTKRADAHDRARHRNHLPGARIPACADGIRDSSDKVTTISRNAQMKDDQRQVRASPADVRRSIFFLSLEHRGPADYKIGGLSSDVIARKAREQVPLKW
jgi:hypothetical protein